MTPAERETDDWNSSNTSLTESELSMRGAVKAAILASEREVHDLRSQIQIARESLQSASRQVQSAFKSSTHMGSGDLSNASGAVTNLLTEASESVDRYFTGYTDVLSTFNIALFGRTGSGKSSLISALAELDGERVSRGESDWTTDVTPVSWNSCRLYDTPGINGWGRTRSVEELESAARQAVEVADVVLLCFDSASQQASEFAKVASWVQEFSKPAIAVLNVRNPMWRHPARVAGEPARANLQKGVREHASNIRDSLSAIGMSGVPVVAIHTKHALDARATEPYVGPDRVNHHKRLQEFGREYLYTWSNLGTLQDLISAIVRSGGTELRASGLREGLRAVFESWNRSLDDEAWGIRKALDVLDASISEELNILGYPGESGVESWMAAPVTETSLLLEVEQARAGPYRAKKAGRFERHVTQVVRNEFGPLRSASLKAASACVRDTFDTKESLSGDEFAERVFDGTALEAAAENAAERCGAFLERELNMTANEAVGDIHLEQMNLSVRGKTGAFSYRIGSASRVGGIATGAVGAALTIAIAANWWNPVGWVGAAAVGTVAVVSSLLSWFGKKKQSSAERKRLKARKDALGDARLGVNDAYTRLEETLAKSIVSEARKQRGVVTQAMLANWLSVHQARLALKSASKEMAASARRSASSSSLGGVMSRAIESIRAGGDSTASAEEILLGASWIASIVVAIEADHEAAAQLSAMGKRDAESLVRALVRRDDHVPDERFLSWLHGIESISDSSVSLVQLLGEARQLTTRSPRIVFLGDYSTGKSSLIKRLLADAGIAIPPTLTVAGRPETSATFTYPWHHLELVDSPGLQSLDVEHEEVAKRSASGASVVIVVLSTNLVIGDHSTLRGLLSGTSLTTPKGRQAIFILGRSDELGVDPLGDPTQFVRLRAQKEAELRAILASWGVENVTVHTVSADPYGTVGDDPVDGQESYQESFRSWDGMHALHSALERTRDHAKEMSMYGAIDFMVDGLMRMRADLARELAEIVSVRADEIQIQETLQRGIDSGRVLSNSLTTDAKAMARTHAERAASNAMSASEDKLDDAAAAASAWWKDQEFHADAVIFYEQAGKAIEAWSAETESELSRDLRWARRRQTRRDASRSDTIRTGVHQGRAAAKTGQILTNVFKERDALYAAAKKFTDIKFKPWGATKAASKVAKAGAVLAVIGVVLDTAAFVSDMAAAGKREKARRQLADSIESTLREVEQLIMRGTKERPGPTTVMDGALQNLRGQREKSARRVQDLEAREQTTQVLINQIDAFVRNRPMSNNEAGAHV